MKKLIQDRVSYAFGPWTATCGNRKEGALRMEEMLIQFKPIGRNGGHEDQSMERQVLWLFEHQEYSKAMDAVRRNKPVEMLTFEPADLKLFPAGKEFAFGN